MSGPSRIQRRRVKGWRAPLDAQGRPPVYVGRGSRWGNPRRVVYHRDSGGWHVEHDHGVGVGTWPDQVEARRFATDAYRYWLQQPEQAGLRSAARAELAGRDLMCWCSLPARGGPDHCHAVVLLEVANRASLPAEEMRAAARVLRDSGRLPTGTAPALAVADWLDEAAESLDRHLSAWTSATSGEPAGVGHGRPEVVTDLAAHHFGRALAVARALAAEAFSALGSDGGGAA